MKKYTKTKVIRISEVQLNTLQKMKSYNVDVGKFIRDAIAEKIKNIFVYLHIEIQEVDIKEINLKLSEYPPESGKARLFCISWKFGKN